MKNELYPGHRVRVRTFAEIAGTLDPDGALDSLPFMPEMIPFCGREFRVFRRLEKTCVEGYGARLIPNTVLLAGLRCDGAAHEGCQRQCPLLWKRAWLEPIDDTSPAEHPSVSETCGGTSYTSLPISARHENSWTLVTPPSEDSVPGQSPAIPLAHDMKVSSLKTRNGDGRYFCQSTQLGQATTYLFPISFRRCTAEFCARNVDFRKAVQFVWVPFVVKLKTKLLGRRFVQPVGNASRTPQEALELQAGEWVEVKTPREIAVTLDRQGRNRGLGFTPDMLPFCGRRYSVKGRVDRAILETTGKMHEFRHTVILQEVTCDGHSILGGCSRDVYHLWREIWLRRVPAPPDRSGAPPAHPQAMPLV